jgi:hypothetical protein
MCGGAFDYIQFRLAMEAIPKLREWLEEKHDNGESDNYINFSEKYTPEVIEQIRVGYKKICEAAIYLQHIDWLFSDDDGGDDFLRRLKTNLDFLEEHGVVDFYR